MNCVSFPVFFLVLLCWVSSVQAQDGQKQPETPDPYVHTRDAEIHMTLTGRVDMRTVFRDGTFNEVLQNFSTQLVGPAGIGRESSDQLSTGRFTLRSQFQFDEHNSFVLQLANKVMDGDLNGNGRIDPLDEFALARDDLRIFVDQGYLDLREFMWPELSMKAGVFDLMYKLRPMGEPFLLHINRAESSFSTNTTGTASRNIVTRQEVQPVGIKMRWDTLGWAVDGFAVVAMEEGSPAADEALYGVFGEVRPFETLSIMAIAMNNTGSDQGANVWTVGGGVDYHVTPYLELFGEAYLQMGTLATSPATIDKKGAYGLETGFRLTRQPWWGEMSFWLMTGDEDPTDSEDNAFQSYEDVNQFLIIEDGIFGLDIDSNVQAVKGTIGYGPVPIGQSDKNLTITVDAGFFELDERMFDRDGTPFIARRGFDLGKEIDATVTIEYSASVAFQLKGALLLDSEVFDALTANGDDSAFVGLFSTTVQF